MTYRSKRMLLTTLLLSASLLGACTRDAPEVPAVQSVSEVDTAKGRALRADTTEGSAVAGATEPLAMTVYKSPTCGCCKDWVSYMQDEGFAATAIDSNDVDAIKATHGLTDPGLKSCHTAIIDGYVIEGHVSADDVRRLLAERPAVVGLSAPGMPMMSPGMGSLQPKDYDVLSFDKDGSTAVWASY